MKSIRFILLLILASNFVFAQSGTVTSQLLPSEINTAVSEQIEISIHVDMSQVNSPDEKLGSFTGMLSWDESILTYQSDSGIKGGFLGNVVLSANKINFNGISSNGVTGDFAVLTVIFDVINTGSSVLDLEYTAMAAAMTFNNLLSILTVSDATVQVGSAPIANFAGNPLSGDAPLTVVFEDQSAGNITEWSWSFPGGDPESGTGLGNKTVTYNQPGSYDVSLTVTGPGGSDTETKSAYILVTGAQTDTVKSSVIPSADSLHPGDPLVVSIQIDASGLTPPNEKLGSFTGYLKWDPAIVTYESNSGIIGGFMGNVVNTLDSIRFNGISSTGVTGDVTVLDVSFSALDPGSCIFNLKYSAMASATTFMNYLPILTVRNDTVHVRLKTNVEKENKVVPADVLLNQNYPNPFNLETNISYQLPEATYIELLIHNIHGQIINTLDFGYKDAGNYQTTWSGYDDRGHVVPSGIYLVTFHAKNPNIIKTRKLVLLK